MKISAIMEGRDPESVRKEYKSIEGMEGGRACVQGKGHSRDGEKK